MAHASRVSKVNHKHTFMFTYVWTHNAHNHVSYLYAQCVCLFIYACMSLLCKALLKLVNASKDQCHYCMRYDHIFLCFVKIVHLNLNSMDLLNANPQGSMNTWMPKNLWVSFSCRCIWNYQMMECIIYCQSTFQEKEIKGEPISIKKVGKTSFFQLIYFW